MPEFAYKCRVCGEDYEFPTNNVDFLCCEQPVRRIYTLGGISFKGKGFYVNEKGK